MGNPGDDTYGVYITKTGRIIQQFLGGNPVDWFVDEQLGRWIEREGEEGRRKIEGESDEEWIERKRKEMKGKIVGQEYGEGVELGKITVVKYRSEEMSEMKLMIGARERRTRKTIERDLLGKGKGKRNSGG